MMNPALPPWPPIEGTVLRVYKISHISGGNNYKVLEVHSLVKDAPEGATSQVRDGSSASRARGRDVLTSDGYEWCPADILPAEWVKMSAREREEAKKVEQPEVALQRSSKCVLVGFVQLHVAQVEVPTIP